MFLMADAFSRRSSSDPDEFDDDEVHFVGSALDNLVNVNNGCGPWVFPSGLHLLVRRGLQEDERSGLPCRAHDTDLPPPSSGAKHSGRPTSGRANR